MRNWKSDDGLVCYPIFNFGSLHGKAKFFSFFVPNEETRLKTHRPRLTTVRISTRNNESFVVIANNIEVRFEAIFNGFQFAHVLRCSV